MNIFGMDGPRPPTLTQMREQDVKNSDFEKYKDYNIRGLALPGLKPKAHQALFEDTNKTSDALQTLKINRDRSIVIIAEMSVFQQPSSNSVTTDSRLTNIEKTLNENSNMVGNHQINATYDPNNPKTKQETTRFCTYCKKTGHAVKFRWALMGKI